MRRSVICVTYNRTVRYFTNVGYNSTPTIADPRRWPAYGTMREMDEISAVALDKGHDRADLGFLFEHHRVFSDEANIRPASK